jgi:hypothetical protein
MEDRAMRPSRKEPPLFQRWKIMLGWRPRHTWDARLLVAISFGMLLAVGSGLVGSTLQMRIGLAWIALMVGVMGGADLVPRTHIRMATRMRLLLAWGSMVVGLIVYTVVMIISGQ